MSHHTAIARKTPSAPMRYLEAQGLLMGTRKLDYGCGRGKDMEHFGMEGYDPHWKPKIPEGKFDLVVCNYVLNVTPIEVQDVILSTVRGFLTPNGVAFFSVRRDIPKAGQSGRGCLQRFVDLNLDLVVSNRSFAIYKMMNISCSGSSAW